MVTQAFPGKRGRIQVGVVGIGRAGWGMHRKELGKLGRLFHIVAACDVSKDRCKQMEADLGCRTYTDIRDLIADPAVEVVDICTRSPEHVVHAILGLKSGKVVFLEKPIALSYAEAKKLKKAAERFGGRLYIRHNRRCEPAFQHIREIVDSGILGDIHTIKLCRGGFQRRDDWQTLIACGGGQLLNWGPHIIDHALHLLGAPVVDMWSHLDRIAAVGDAEDHLRIILKGANQCVADIQISGGVAINEPEYILHGSRGSLVTQGGKIKLRYVSPKQTFRRIKAKESSPPNEAGFGNPEKLRWIEKEIPIKPRLKVDTDTSLWKHLYKTLREDAPFPITIDEALAVMEVVSKVKKGTRFERRAGRSSLRFKTTRGSR